MKYKGTTLRISKYLLATVNNVIFPENSTYLLAKLNNLVNDRGKSLFTGKHKHLQEENTSR